ncbi:MAG: ATP-dependent DNA helicase [Clostridia bacterium]|nr:ATP-dependent DNA helicase [Clostridia bacterium]
MRFIPEGSETGSVLVTAAEICGRAPTLFSSSDAKRLSGDRRAVSGRSFRASFESGGAVFTVDASPEGWIPVGDGSGIILEFDAGASRRSGISLYSTVCAAAAGRALGLKKITVMTVKTTRGGHRQDAEPLETVTHDVDVERASEKTEGMLLRLAPRAAFERERIKTLLPAIPLMKFPYPSLREGQRELIERVYSSVKRSSRLFVSAPTGIGKTVSVLYGSLRAMADGSFRRIFYLTAKQSTRREAFAAVSKLAPALPGLRAIVLAPKEQTCPYKGLECDRTRCPLAAEKTERKSRELLARELAEHRGYPSGHVRQAALDAGVCPYEFSLDLSEYCDIIICDYNSVFDPGARIRRYFVNSDPSDSVLLVDEAHNLPGRARESFSAVFSSRDLLPLMPFLEESPELCGAVEQTAASLDGCARLCSENSFKEEDGSESGWYYSASLPESAGLREAMSSLDGALYRFRAAHRNDPEALAAVRATADRAASWRDTAEAYDDRYRTYLALDHGVVSARLFCLDPSGRLDAILSSVRASVFFSATLTPSDYYADLLGGGRGCEKVSLPSPYPPENLFVGIYVSADTRFEAREASVRRVTAAVAATVSAKRGNYMVFFPSYGYMNAVGSAFAEKYPNVKLKIQSRNMTMREKNAFLDFFPDDSDELRIGFCVLGGSFSEGIDLPGERLIGTVIVGVGLPGLSEEGNIIRDYYENRSGDGFDYAYVFPGMNSVLQAAGRVIRSDSDRGAVILVDDRYDTEKYRAMMPEHWHPKRFSDAKEMRSALIEFWNTPRNINGF